MKFKGSKKEQRLNKLWDSVVGLDSLIRQNLAKKTYKSKIERADGQVNYNGVLAVIADYILVGLSVYEDACKGHHFFEDPEQAVKYAKETLSEMIKDLKVYHEKLSSIDINDAQKVGYFGNQILYNSQDLEQLKTNLNSYLSTRREIPQTINGFN